MLVDMPLQHASAHIARAFAIHMGHALTPDHLRLMFTPDFGMFIAPGCNGMRGSITMGYIALIAGYVYRFRWYASVLVVTGAVFLAYVFNLARLCMLVVYYMVALHIPSLQDKAESADYVIGAILFLVATLLLFGVIHRLRDVGNADAAGGASVADGDGSRNQTSRAEYARLAAMGAITLLGCTGVARAIALNNPFAVRAADAPEVQFPAHFGKYALVRTWNEGPPAEAVVYVWAQYAPADGGTPIAIGVSPVPDWHDPALCHFVRGQDPLWHGQLAIATAGGVPVSFSSAIYNDGVTQWLEASTLCRGESCGEFTTQRDHFGFVYTHPEAGALLSASGRTGTRVLLRVENIDSAAPADRAREQLTADLRDFLVAVKLDDLTRPYSH
jgi:exosortase J